ncbi:GNAT family N-acetyltransferase [Hymenobacter lucidus]|uniref:GNAT family N-acetyltransferase n=1 Tax=Hymenobacter lucidus TaxID=2880930 RepID=A0ABS8AQW4_9BACT|nr:GNAT family N-acetyltransferase [Hymenobacter lucidus]MCB2408494.1 GNAT family N-acetyltransferase [Hymenobacter lucidus]
MNSAPHVSLLEWDSAFFGFPTGRLQASGLSIVALRNILAEAKQEGYQLLYWFVTPTDTQSLTTAQTLGLPVMDEKRTYSWSVKNVPLRPTDVHPFSAAMATPPLVELAVQSGIYSRFRLDPDFAPGVFEKLYAQWLATALTGADGQQVFAYYPAAVTTAVGLLTLEKQPDSSRIGLLAVAEHWQKQGVGKQLVTAAQWEAHAAGSTQLLVTTQGANRAACALYESCGFVLHERQVVFHLWLAGHE